MKKMIFIVMMVAVISSGSLAFAGEKNVYTVKAGDTLGELMFAWKVQGVDVKQIYKWNPNLGTQIVVGQRIVYYLPDQPVAQKLSAEEVKKIVDETIAAQNRNNPQIAKSGLNLVEYLSLAGIGVALFIVIAAFFVSLRNKKQLATKETSPKAADNKVTIKLEKNGLYETDIEFDLATERWLTPFRHLEGEKERMWAKSEGDAKRSARNCWKNTEKFSEQIDKLIADKIIRPTNKKAAA